MRWSLPVSANIPESLLKNLQKFFHRINRMEASIEVLKLSLAAALEKSTDAETKEFFLQRFEADVASRVPPPQDTDQMMDAVLYVLRHGSLPEA